MLFHDHAGEMEIFDRALRAPAFYLGALGSRRVHADRLALLTARGWSPAALSRIRGPVGLDLGARTPPEIALSISAEIIECWRRTRADGRTGIGGQGRV